MNIHGYQAVFEELCSTNSTFSCCKSLRVLTVVYQENMVIKLWLQSASTINLHEFTAELCDLHICFGCTLASGVHIIVHLIFKYFIAKKNYTRSSCFALNEGMHLGCFVSI